MSRESVQTSKAPAAIGPYSQAIKADRLVFLSGQIALDPSNGQLLAGGVEAQARQAFTNLAAVAEAAGATLANAVKLTLFLTDLKDFSTVNAVMQEFFQPPYPARSTIEVSALPRGACFEVEAILLRQD